MSCCKDNDLYGYANSGIFFEWQGIITYSSRVRFPEIIIIIIIIIITPFHENTEKCGSKHYCNSCLEQQA